MERELQTAVYLTWRELDEIVESWFAAFCEGITSERGNPFSVFTERDETDFNIAIRTKLPGVPQENLEPYIAKVEELLAANEDLATEYDADWDINDMMFIADEGKGLTVISLPKCLSCRLISSGVGLPSVENCCAIYDGVYFFHVPSECEAEGKEETEEYGHWVDAVVGDMPVQVCDKCNTFYPLAYTGGGHKFCPNCGKPMLLPVTET